MDTTSPTAVSLKNIIKGHVGRTGVGDMLEVLHDRKCAACKELHVTVNELNREYMGKLVKHVILEGDV